MILSVCLLVYNHAHILPIVIESILNQSFSDFELIVSDDCSTDDSYQVSKSFEKRDHRITVIKTQQNLGMAGNANYAISKARNKYIALLHHDDILNIETFKHWLDCIESNESIGYVFNDYKTELLPSTNYYLHDKIKLINQGKKFLKCILLGQWGSPVRGSALIRKKYFDEIGGMDERFGMLADVDLWMRLASKYDVGYINLPLIKVLENRPENYPNEYTEFSWLRIFLLFEIHASNINRNNYPNYLRYIFKRIIFRNNVSFEIIKWHGYALMKNKILIIKSYSYSNNKYEFFYSRLVRFIVNEIILILKNK